MFLIAQGLLAFILILYTFMHYYIYQIMVTYKVKFGKLYKNAMLFAIAKFPQNIIFTLLSGGLLLGVFILLNVFSFLAFVIVFTAICKFIIEFYVRCYFEKHTAAVKNDLSWREKTTMKRERQDVLVAPEQIQVQKEYIHKIKHYNAQLGAQPLAFVVTYGCQQNENDSERIRGMLAEAGYGFCDKAEDADLILYNTCAVREHAELKVYGNLGALDF